MFLLTVLEVLKLHDHLQEAVTCQTIHRRIASRTRARVAQLATPLLVEEQASHLE